MSIYCTTCYNECIDLICVNTDVLCCHNIHVEATMTIVQIDSSSCRLLPYTEIVKVCSVNFHLFYYMPLIQKINPQQLAYLVNPQ